MPGFLATYGKQAPHLSLRLELGNRMFGHHLAHSLPGSLLIGHYGPASHSATAFWDEQGQVPPPE